MRGLNLGALSNDASDLHLNLDSEHDTVALSFSHCGITKTRHSQLCSYICSFLGILRHGGCPGFLSLVSLQRAL